MQANMAESCYQTVKGWILTLQLAPGKRITEDQIVAWLGSASSKTPVRDALRWLVRDGFVQKSGRGYRVAPITAKTTRDLYAFRMVLETGAVRRLLARRRPLDALAAWRSSETLAYDPSEPDSVRQYLCESDEFHKTLATAAGCRALTASLVLTLERLQPAMNLMLRSVTPEWLSSCEHRALAEEILSADDDRAVRAIEDHLRIAEQLVLEVLLNLDSEIELPDEMASAIPTPTASLRSQPS